MRSPLSAWRAGIRWPLVTLTVVGFLVVGVLVCEVLGWPFLAGPVQNQLAKTLDRRVVFGAGDDRGVRIGLLGSVRVRAASIEIGAPAWSQSPHMLLVRDGRLKLGYLDLWRAYRGQPLRIASLEAAVLDARLERLADGRASWQFGDKPPEPAEDPDKPTTLPSFGTLEVADGHVVVRDEGLPVNVDARFSLSERGGVVSPNGAASGAATVLAGGRATASGASSPAFVPSPNGQTPPGLQLVATGDYKKLPLNIDLRSSGITTLFGDGAKSYAQPLSLLASVGRAELSFGGTVTDPIHFGGMQGRFRVSGPSLAAAGDPLGVTLPSTPPFTTGGTIAKDGKVYKAVFDDAAIGSSRLNGAFTYDTGRRIPLLAGRLGGSRLVLADLGPAVGAPAPAASASAAKAKAKTAAPGDKVIPDKKFDLPSLRAMDANVLVDIAYLDLGTTLLEPLKPLRTHLLLSDGVLTLTDLEASTAKGRLLGYLQLDGRSPQALWTADLRLLGIDLTQWLNLDRGAGKPAYISGKLDGQVKVAGKGRSTAEILSSLDGGVRFRLRDATLSHLIVEAGGIDVAQALGMVFKGDDALPIQCNLADLSVDKGVIRPKVFVLNTADSTFWIDGTVSLRDEGIDLRTVVSPKDFSPLTLRTPIRVRGTLGDPSVSLEYGKLVGKAGAAALLSLLNPLAAILPFIDTGSKDDAKKGDEQCMALAKRSGAIAKPVSQPTQLPVPDAASGAGTRGARRR